MKKKLLATLLLAAMIVCLAACGQAAPSKEPEEPAKSETTETASGDEAVTPEKGPAVKEEITEDAPSAETPAETPAVEKETAEASAALELSAVRDTMIEQLKIEDPFLLETDALLDLYGITSDSVAQSASFVTMSGTFPDEIIMVEAVDEASAASIAEALQHRLDEVMVQSESYDPDNYAAAQACQVTVKDLFVSLILSPKQAEMAEIYAGFMAE